MGIETAAQTGEQPTDTGAPAGGAAPDTGATGGGEGGEAPAAVPSTSEALDIAFAKMTETESAADVLKNGANGETPPAGETEAQKAARDAAGKFVSTDPEKVKAAEAARLAAAEAAKNPDAAKLAADEAAKAAAAAAGAPGKFEAPVRLSPAAKAAWDQAPEPLRADVVRMHDEMAKGIETYKASAERYEPLSKYQDMAQEFYGIDLPAALENYVAMDQLLGEDLFAGLEKLVSSRGYQDPETGKMVPYTLRQIAEEILDTPEDTRFNTETSELKRELADVKRQLSEVSGTISKRTEAEKAQANDGIQKSINDFAASKPRWTELEGTVHKILQGDLIERTGTVLGDLTKAYEMADRLKPASTITVPAPSISAADKAAQTRRGSASVSGAPTAGSNPGERKPVPSTPEDAVGAAFAHVGLPTR